VEGRARGDELRREDGTGRSRHPQRCV